MSRSNPHEGAPNPAVRWFEWNGEKGLVHYYDKEQKKNVDVGAEFTFILLDQLGRVGGWSKQHDCAIYSNEIKDVRQERLVVKTRKGGILAEGLYKDIKAAVNADDGCYVANCYIAFKHNGGLSIGSLQFKGAALHAWAEVAKAHRGDLYTHAVAITGYTEGKKGRITFRVPVLKLVPLTEDTNRIAVALDAELQAWLKGYFARTTTERVDDDGDASEPPPVDDERPEPPPFDPSDNPW